MVCLPSYSVLAETSIDYLAPANSRSVDIAPQIGPSHFEHICGTNLRTLSGP